MEFIGIVKRVLPQTSGVSQRGTEWRKQDAVLEETDVQYPQSIVVTQMNDTIDQQRLIEGRRVKAHLSIRTNEYNGRWFNSVSCWKVDNLDEQPSPVTNSEGQHQQTVPAYQPQQQMFPGKTDMADDLPF